ncbi:hypothetical protein HZU73_08407 [Apis mellifera caucasica]|nr:hypothetical protein HZU73_08407 [Apis mellifera caucasica]KAG9428010.1 hypothetical protein HZU67_10327 [Apis mellifera carnica]
MVAPFIGLFVGLSHHVSSSLVFFLFVLLVEKSFQARSSIGEETWETRLLSTEPTAAMSRSIERRNREGREKFIRIPFEERSLRETLRSSRPPDSATSYAPFAAAAHATPILLFST